MRTIIITGASRGIGKHLATRMAAPDVNLVVGARDQSALQGLCAELQGKCGRCVPLQLDVSDSQSISAFFTAVVGEFQEIDVLVNNAGMGFYGLAGEVDDGKARQLFDVNFFGLMQCCREAIPHMPAGGKIVNIASEMSFRGLPLMSVYCASKAAVRSFSESLRVEVSERGLKVLVFYPGYVNTDFHQKANELSSIKREIRSRPHISVEKFADYTARHIEKGSRENIPCRNGWFFRIVNGLCPGMLDYLLTRKYSR